MFQRNKNFDFDVVLDSMSMIHSKQSWCVLDEQDLLLSEFAATFWAAGAAASKDVPRRTELWRIELWRIEAGQGAEIGLDARVKGYPERKNNEIYSAG